MKAACFWCQRSVVERRRNRHGSAQPFGFLVDFSVSPSTGVRNFTFNGSASSSPGHAITTYAWKFSDGTVKTGGSPVVEHDFGSSGTYVVTLTITDDIGQEGSKSILLQVS